MSGVSDIYRNRAVLGSIPLMPIQMPAPQKVLSNYPFLRGGMKAYWPLRANSVDSVGGWNGTDTSITYGLLNGMGVRGASLNGSSSAIDLPLSFPELTADWTVMMWLKRTSLPQTTDATLFNRWKNTTTERQLCIYFHANSYGSYLQVDIPYVKAVLQSSSVLTDIVLWHHIAVTKSATTWTAYLDGSSWGTVEDASSQESAPTAAPTIGRGASANYFPGWINELAIFDRGLSATEIANYYTWVNA